LKEKKNCTHILTFAISVLIIVVWVSFSSLHWDLIAICVKCMKCKENNKTKQFDFLSKKMEKIAMRKQKNIHFYGHTNVCLLCICERREAEREFKIMQFDTIKKSVSCCVLYVYEVKKNRHEKNFFLNHCETSFATWIKTEIFFVFFGREKLLQITLLLRVVSAKP
jgi:hypothetical protein